MREANITAKSLWFCPLNVKNLFILCLPVTTLSVIKFCQFYKSLQCWLSLCETYIYWYAKCSNELINFSSCYDVTLRCMFSVELIVSTQKQNLFHIVYNKTVSQK